MISRKSCLKAQKYIDSVVLRHYNVAVRYIEQATNRKGVPIVSEREQEDKLLKIFRELGKEERPKLLNVGEIMIALKNLPSPPKASA